MEFLVYLIIFIVGSIIVAALNANTPDPLEPSRALAQKFKLLGNMTGMHKETIIKIAGQPNSWSNIGNDLLLQWILPGYHISIMFDHNGFFKTINSETYTA